MGSLKRSCRREAVDVADALLTIRAVRIAVAVVVRDSRVHVKDGVSLA